MFQSTFANQRPLLGHVEAGSEFWFGRLFQALEILAFDSSGYDYACHWDFFEGKSWVGFFPEKSLGDGVPTYGWKSENSGFPPQPWVFLLKMTILGCFGGTTIVGNTHISPIYGLYNGYNSDSPWMIPRNLQQDRS